MDGFPKALSVCLRCWCIVDKRCERWIYGQHYELNRKPIQKNLMVTWRDPNRPSSDFRPSKFSNAISAKPNNKVMVNAPIQLASWNYTSCLDRARTYNIQDESWHLVAKWRPTHFHRLRNTAQISPTSLLGRRFVSSCPAQVSFSLCRDRHKIHFISTQAVCNITCDS